MNRYVLSELSQTIFSFMSKAGSLGDMAKMTEALTQGSTACCSIHTALIDYSSRKSIKLDDGEIKPTEDMGEDAFKE